MNYDCLIIDDELEIASGVCEYFNFHIKRRSINQKRTDPENTKRQTTHNKPHGRLHKLHGAGDLKIVLCNIIISLLELCFLEILRIIRPDYTNACQVFPRHTVEVVGQRLYPPEPGQRV